MTAVKQCEEVADHVADKSGRPCSGAGRGEERRRQCGWPILANTWDCFALSTPALANMWDRFAKGIFGRTLCVPESLRACALFKRPFRCVVSHHAFVTMEQYILCKTYCTCGQGLIDGLQQLSHSLLFRNLPQRLHQCFCQPSMSLSYNSVRPKNCSNLQGSTTRISLQNKIYLYTVIG